MLSCLVAASARRQGQPSPNSGTRLYQFGGGRASLASVRPHAAQLPEHVLCKQAPSSETPGMKELFARLHGRLFLGPPLVHASGSGYSLGSQCVVSVTVMMSAIEYPQGTSTRLNVSKSKKVRFDVPTGCARFSKT